MENTLKVAENSEHSVSYYFHTITIYVPSTTHRKL